MLMGIGVLAIGMTLLHLKGCHKKGTTNPSNPTNVKLPITDKEEIIVSNNQVQVVSRNASGQTVVKTVTGTRGAKVEVKKDGTIKVTEKTHGWALNPMLGAGINSTGPKAVIAYEIYYYKKLDLIGGMGADKFFSHTAFFAAVGYTPINKFFHGNTSFWIGPMMDVGGGKGVMAGFALRI